MSGQNGCLCDLDPSVAYDGPRATIATLGGSPTWGLGDRFHEFAAEQGHTRLGVHRPRTPYGLGPQVEHYRAPTGREFLRIPTYGQVIDEDPLLRASEWKTFWILWRAGVRILLVGGTSGKPVGGEARATRTRSAPGDFVLPRDYLPRDTMPTGLPGRRSSSSAWRGRSRSWTTPCPTLAQAIRNAAPRRSRNSASGASTAPRRTWSSTAGWPATASSRSRPAARLRGLRTPDRACR